MFRFLIGVAFGAAGYWAWVSFGRDLLGMGGDQDTSYGSFNSSGPSGTGFGSTSPSGPSSFGTTNPPTPPTSTGGTTGAEA